MTDLERVKKIIKWLIYQGIGDNEKEISEKLGYNKGYLSQLLNGKKPLSESFIDKLIELDPNINKVWILTGHGSIHKSSDSDKELLLTENKYLKEINQLLKSQIESSGREKSAG